MITHKISDRTGESHSFFATPGQRLLQAGLAAGLGIPHECATGSCGSCKACVVSGEVVSLWPNAPGTKLCRSANEILLCQSSANEPVELAVRNIFAQPCDPPCAEITGLISATRVLTPEISEFSVRLSEPLNYKPGQFVLLSGLGVDGPRAYSMTRHQSDKPELNFLIRKDQKGEFSKALFERASVGRLVTVFGPLGKATFTSDECRPFFAVAGGTGIAGVLAIIHHSLDVRHFRKNPSHLLFGLRDTSSSYLLDDLVSAVELSDGGLSVTIALSDELCPVEFKARFPLLCFTDGFVHDVVRRMLAGERDVTKSRPLYFVAGPPAMVNATMRSLVIESKISPTEIRYDRFG